MRISDWSSDVCSSDLLALPHWLSGDKLYRVILAFALFYAVYQAEILRSGFQALSSGQEEAGNSLGLTYGQNVFLVLLPQVFKLSLPPTINQVAITFKETSDRKSTRLNSSH